MSILKYLRMNIKLNLIVNFKYKINLVTEYFTLLVLPILINYLFSKSMVDYRNISLDYDLILYVILSNFILKIVISNLEFNMEADIKSGKFIYKQIQPMKTSYIYFLSDLSAKLAKALPLFFLVLPIIVFRSGSIKTSAIIPSIVFISIALILGFLISFFIGSLSFNFVEVWGISAIKSLTMAVFTGSLFSLDILPECVFVVLKKLPFAYLSYYPSLALGMTKFAYKNVLIMGLIWIFIFFIFNRIIWEYGLTKYEGTIE